MGVVFAIFNMYILADCGRAVGRWKRHTDSEGVSNGTWTGKGVLFFGHKRYEFFVFTGFMVIFKGYILGFIFNIRGSVG